VRRWVAVGSSNDAEPRRAGEAAASAALSGRTDAALIMVFCWALYEPEQVLAGIREITGDTPLIGCSTTAIISPGAPTPVPEAAAPTPVPEAAAPTPVPEAAAPTPVPEADAPTPVPEAAAPPAVPTAAGREAAISADVPGAASPRRPPGEDAAGQADHGVVVVALGGAGFSVTTAVGRECSTHPRETGATVAACTATLPEDHSRALLLFTDGLIGGTEEILAGAYGVIGASMPMLGGASSPDPSVTRTFQFHGGEVVSDALVGAAIASDGPFGIGVRHGWSKVGDAMIVTKSSRNEVYTLDDQPAAEAYLRRLGAPPEAFADSSAFELFAERRPIGVRTRSGEVVRHVGSSSRLDSGWLHASGDVPEGGLIWPMVGDLGTVLAAADDAFHDATAALAGVEPLGLIAFDCETRGRFLGVEGRREEVSRMVRSAGSAPLAGLYTWGEIARTKGINGFHNQTLVVLAVG
jgi:hypothetical protein